MSLLSRLLKIWLVGRTVSATTPLLMRLVVGIALVSLLVALGAVLLAILIGMVVWFAYGQLIANGATDYQAMATIAGSILLLLTLIALWIRVHWLRSMGLIRNIAYLRTPISGRINMFSDAFMAGFNNK
jgi:predicted permease